MSEFDDREKAFEAREAHDREMLFKATARRNKLLGLWAAETLGLSGADAEKYASDVVMSDFEEPGDDDVLRKVLADLQAKGVDTSEHLVRKQMDDLMDAARAQIAKEA